jgi:hypothetical protein
MDFIEKAEKLLNDQVKEFANKPEKEKIKELWDQVEDAKKDMYENKLVTDALAILRKDRYHEYKELKGPLIEDLTKATGIHFDTFDEENPTRIVDLIHIPTEIDNYNHHFSISKEVYFICMKELYEITKSEEIKKFIDTWEKFEQHVKTKRKYKLVREQ